MRIELHLWHKAQKAKKNLPVTKLSINQIRQFLYIMNSNQRKEQCLKQIQTFAVYIIPSWSP